MDVRYTAVVEWHDPWWIGWVEEIPGINSQGATREELLDNLRNALEESHQLKLVDLRREIQIGIDQADRGEVSTFNDATLDGIQSAGKIRFALRRRESEMP